MHRKYARRIWGILKKSVSWALPSEEEGWLSLARRGLVSDAHMAWGRWKSHVYLSPYVEKTLNSKVIKSFVPELRSCQVFFVFRDSYVLCDICYEYSMYISHIHVWLCYINSFKKINHKMKIQWIGEKLIRKVNGVVSHCLNYKTFHQQ